MPPYESKRDLKAAWLMSREESHTKVIVLDQSCWISKPNTIHHAQRPRAADKAETTTKCAQTQEWVHSTNATLQINAQPTQPPTFSSLITAHQSVICLHRDRKMCSDDSIYVRHTDLIQQVRLYLVLTWELFYTEYRNVHQGWET